MKIRFQGCFFYVNDNSILLSHDIYGLIELDNVVIVLIYGASTEQMKTLPTNNIYAFNEKGEQVWQIQEPFQLEGTSISYADISLKKNGRIIAGTTQGTEYIVNIENGFVEPLKGRRPW